MKCNKCGSDLKEIYELNEQELLDLTFISKTANAIKMVEEETDLSEMTDEQVLEFYNAIHSKMAALDTTRYIFSKNLRKKLNINRYETIQDGKVYVHPNCEEDVK